MYNQTHKVIQTNIKTQYSGYTPEERVAYLCECVPARICPYLDMYIFNICKFSALAFRLELNIAERRRPLYESLGRKPG